jgi:HAMP domain-containing protein
VVAVALLGVAVVAIVPIYDEIRERQAAQDRARENLLLTSRLAAQTEAERHGHMRDLLFFTSQFMRVVNAIPEPRNELVLADCQLALAGVTAELPQITGVRLSKPNGDLICSSLQPALPSPNIGDLPFFRRAVDQDEFAVGDFLVGSVSGRPVQPFAMPVHDQAGTIIAVLNTALWLDTDDPLVVAENVPEGAEITLIDRRGIVLRSTKYAPGDQYGSLGTVDDLRDSTLIESDVGGDTIHGVTRITAPDQTRTLAVVSISERALLPSVLDDLVPSMAAIVVLALITGAAIWLLIERLLGQPVKQLVHASERIAGGDLSARVDVRDGTELQVLAERFNLMGDQLESRAAALEEALAVSFSASSPTNSARRSPSSSATPASSRPAPQHWTRRHARARSKTSSPRATASTASSTTCWSSPASIAASGPKLNPCTSAASCALPLRNSRSTYVAASPFTTRTPTPGSSPMTATSSRSSPISSRTP